MLPVPIAALDKIKEADANRIAAETDTDVLTDIYNKTFREWWGCCWISIPDLLTRPTIIDRLAAQLAADLATELGHASLGNETKSQGKVFAGNMDGIWKGSSALSRVDDKRDHSSHAATAAHATSTPISPRPPQSTSNKRHRPRGNRSSPSPAPASNRRTPPAAGSPRPSPRAPAAGNRGGARANRARGASKPGGRR